MLIVNLGGEGEDIVAVRIPPGSTIVHVNPLDYSEDLVMAPVRTGFEDALRTGHELVRRLAHDTGLYDDCADAVVGQSLPIQMNPTQDLTRSPTSLQSRTGSASPAESSPFQFSSCDLAALAETFRQAGFTDVYLDEHGYARGRKP